MPVNKHSELNTRKPELVEPPDGGWGWMITVAYFFITLFIRGSEAAMSVVYVEFLGYFKAGGAVTSGIISVFTAANFCAGSIGAELSNKFGIRKVAMLGSVLSCLAFFASSFATGIVYLYISLGICAGCSFGLVLVPPMVLMGHYFKRRFVIASSLSLTGQGVGVFILPPLCQFLLDHYGWRGTLMIFASISANTCVCAALLRPIHLQEEYINEQAQNDNVQMTLSDKCDTENSDGLENQGFSDTQINETRQEQRATCTYQAIDICQNRESLETNENKHSKINNKNENKLLAVFRETPLFTALAVSHFLYAFGSSIVFNHFVDAGIRKGTSHVDAAFLKSIMGIVTCICSIATGFLLDCCGIEGGRIYAHSLGYGIFAVATIVVPTANSYPMLVVISVVLGIGRGIFSVLDPVCVKQVVGIQRLAEGFAVTTFFVGLGFLIGPPLSGYFLDKTQSYNTSFYSAAGILIVGVLVMAIPTWYTDNRNKGRHKVNDKKGS
ncbi:monocarboxylate transporter 12-like [Glandiceps talaboti]